MNLTLISWTLEDYKMEKHHFYLVIDQDISIGIVRFTTFAILLANEANCVPFISVIHQAYEQRKTIETL